MAIDNFYGELAAIAGAICFDIVGYNTKNID